METLLIYRERLLKFISKQGMQVRFLTRFIGGFLLFYAVSQIYGYNDLLSQIFVTVVCGLVCVFVPVSIVFMMFNILVILQLASLSIEIAMVYFVVIGLYHLIYQRMVPQAKVLFIMTPVFFFFHVPAVLPLFVGTFIGASGIPAILMGSFCYFFANIVYESVTKIDTGASTSHMYNLVLQGTTENKELMLCIIAFVLVAAVVAAIHKSRLQYGWYISIFTGGVLYLIVTLVGGYFFGYQVAIGVQVLTVLVSILIVMAMQLLHNVVDYTKEENLEFEDEEYYYYVKAIPKISVEEEEFHITKITMTGRRFHVKKKDDEGEES